MAPCWWSSTSVLSTAFTPGVDGERQRGVGQAFVRRTAWEARPRLQRRGRPSGSRAVPRPHGAVAVVQGQVRAGTRGGSRDRGPRGARLESGDTEKAWPRSTHRALPTTVSSSHALQPRHMAFPHDPEILQLEQPIFNTVRSAAGGGVGRPEAPGEDLVCRCHNVSRIYQILPLLLSRWVPQRATTCGMSTSL